jgi:hypothetical protein
MIEVTDRDEGTANAKAVRRMAIFGLGAPGSAVDGGADIGRNGFRRSNGQILDKISGRSYHYLVHGGPGHDAEC